MSKSRLRVFEVTLRFRVAMLGENVSPRDIDVKDLRSQAESRLNRWSDGRYGFAVEQLQHGLSEVIMKAAHDARDAQLRTYYPRGKPLPKAAQQIADLPIEVQHHGSMETTCTITEVEDK